MTRPRMVLAAVACAAPLALTAAGPAAAATSIAGTVVGAPTTSGASATVPVLVSETSRQKLRLTSPLLRVRVPSAGGIRAVTGRLAPGGLRIGDRARASVGAVRRGVASTKVLRVTQRGGSASFDRLAASRERARAQAQAAADAVARLDSTASGVVGAPADTPEQLRGFLMDLRYDLNLLVADLLALGDQTTDAIARIERERPTDPARRAAVARRQAPLIASLRDSRDQTATTRLALEDAVTRLDRAILDVGGVSAPSLPIGTVGTVSNVVQAVLAIIGELQVPTGR